MALSTVKQHRDSDKPITAEERALLRNYRQLARWDRTFLFMILQSLANGRYTPESDKDSWDEIRAGSDLPKSRRAAA
jgi:hypothetical protein